jgi:hypothetical protein
MKQSQHTFLLLLVLVLSLPSFTTTAQIDTISLVKKDLVISQLTPGLHQYLVYFERPKQKKIMMPMLWNRQVDFKQFKGKPTIEVTQNWYATDTLLNRYIYSINSREDFSPIYQYGKSARGVEAFEFEQNRVSGSDTVASNSKKEMEVKSTASTLNWELDMEVFSMLPYKKTGQTFVINFYHPGGKTEPMYYQYKVIGSEAIQGTNTATIDCWQLKISYNETSWAIFWISKKSKEVLKMQEYFGGGYRYKVKLATPVPPSRP